MFRLLPKEEKYFDLFNNLASQMNESAQLLQKLFSDFDNRSTYAEQIKAVEHICDEITHDIIKKLNQTFITPIDREDIHALASGLDDIVDAIEYTAKRVMLYHVAQSTEHARKMTDVMVRLTAKLQDAVTALANNGELVLQDCVAIHTLENEGDVYHHEAVEKLFAEEKDPITIIKMKEIYEKLERMIDKAEDVANVLEAIVLKNA
jgi:predicted phosphate transport protein (TIGR00153 family)